MKPRILIVAVLIAVLLLGSTAVFTVEEGTLTVVEELGRVRGGTSSPGLYFKLPWPLSRIVSFEGRAQVFQGKEEQVLTADQYTFRVRPYLLWRILPEGVARFHQAVGTPERFEGQVAGLVRSLQNAEFGRQPLAAIFPASSTGPGLLAIEESVRRDIAPKCREQYGVEVLSVGFTQIGVTQAVLQDVYNKMSAERQQLSATLKSEGEAQAKRIRVEAQARYDSALAETGQKARAILAQAEADSSEAYRSLAADPELALHLKKLETLAVLLKDRATMVIDPRTAPFDLLLSTPASP